MQQDHYSDKAVQEVAERIVRSMATPPYVWPHGFEGVLPPTFSAAARWLRSRRYIEHLTGTSYLTPEGWDYWQRLRLGPVLFWFKHNWFPATVAAATILVGIGTILAQVLPLLLD